MTHNQLLSCYVKAITKLLNISVVHCVIDDDICIILCEKSETYIFGHEHSIEQVDWLNTRDHSLGGYSM